MMDFFSKTFRPDNILIGEDALQPMNLLPDELNIQPRDIFVLTDEHVSEFCLPQLSKNIKELPFENIIKFPPGEKSKDLKNAETIYRKLIEKGASRNSLLINLGGGVVTDLGGFVASTFKRGMRFVHVPTSLMGQVDAAIGGKTAVNINGIKNQVGTFAFPERILIYPAFVKTLPEKELFSGFAEVLKHALIADPDYLGYLLEQNLHGTGTNWEMIIKRSVEIKSDIVLQDPYDLEARRKLNFGHTIGHAIETLMQEKNRNVSHGGAVAAGMMCESCLAYLKKMISHADFTFILNSIHKFFKKIEFETADFDRLLELMVSDKKNETNRISFSLPDRIGNVRISCEAKQAEILECLGFYKAL